MRILQMFNWKLRDIIAELDNVRNQGFTHIQTSPLQKSKEGFWWGFYQPMNLEVGNSLGTIDELKELTQEAHKRGLKVIIDVVTRHCATDDRDCTKPNHQVADYMKNYVIDRPKLYNDNDRYQVVHNNCGMPMIDYENDEYIIYVIRYFESLFNAGIDMIRLDQAKHYSLPGEFGEGNFIRTITERFGRDRIIGEVLFEEDKDLLRRFTDNFYVFSMNVLSGNDRIVTAIECHDHYLNRNERWSTCRMSSEQIVREYEYLCGFAKNTLFYTRPFDNAWKDYRVRNGNNK